MNSDPLPVPPEDRRKVMTACGWFIPLEADTPRSQFEGKPVYFCLLDCKEDFDQNPARSCYTCQLSCRLDPENPGDND